MRFMEPTRAQKTAYRHWLASRRPAVRAILKRFDIWSLYRLKPTGQYVLLRGVDEHEDGSFTARVDVTSEWNSGLLFDRQVFGIALDELEVCDVLPEREPSRTALLSQDDVNTNIDQLRLLIRPDLWAVDDAGRVVRKQ